MIHKNFFFRLKYCLLTKLKTQMTRHSSLQCLHAFSVKCLLRPLYFVVVQGRQRNVGEKCDARTVQSYFFAHLTYSFVWSSRIPSEKICVQTKPSILSIRAIFLWPWKTVSVSVRYLFYQPVDGKIKAWTLRFLAKEKPNMRKHCSIGQSFCSMTSKRSIGWFLENSQAYNYEVFSPSVRLTNQKPRAFVSVW